ncbi:Tn3 family transposase [Streptomyces sp. NPDC053431]|uniref:Tn3 family transposase n=1 Tax=Streptomyces sp. NPDC053431 TaxID=3365703 RepID=UPI0037D6BA51
MARTNCATYVGRICPPRPLAPSRSRSRRHVHARSTELWGQGSTAVASDSAHVRAYDQNLFTEWHSRYGGRGVLIYWHVEKKSLVIHSQLINCTRLRGRRDDRGRHAARHHHGRRG